MQTSLPFMDPAQRRALFGGSGDGLEADFWQFHRQNPVIYDLLVRYAREAKRARRRRFGVDAIWERMRWYVNVETEDPTGLKLNNNHRSRYARLLMELERCQPACSGCADPHCLAGLFELRTLKTKTAFPR